MMLQRDLDGWQDLLQQHFDGLYASSGCNGGARPLFALEHGLDQKALESLSHSIQQHVSVNVPLVKHWLAWIVYATEIGYRYCGDEFWQTFEEETPGWPREGDRYRYWIRDCYWKFQKRFNGAVPTGVWAEHFSIICWPITHAILPRDLQRQLARILYEHRYEFSAEVFESTWTLGEFIADRSWNSNSRFANLAQQPQLLGQIASALLLEAKSENHSLIFSSTLRRIAEDLERERQAREWLSGARKFAHDRVNIKGLLPLRTKSPSPYHSPEQARSDVIALGIEPSILLRPTNQSRTSWDVSLEIPNLSQLLFRFPRIQGILTGSRCIVAGSSGMPLARSRCLYGAQQIRLLRWPRNDEVLLTFEEKDSLLEYLLRTECLLRPAAKRLFRLASDGLAYESQTLRVRPGQRYILLSTSQWSIANKHTRSISIDCEGIYGIALDLPTALDSDWDKTLRSLGLGQARSIEVWPAGLDAIVWDGEGRGEWLASESPCLALCTDHPVDALLVSMEADLFHPLEIKPVFAGEPVFVQFPSLPVGLHKVRVSSRAETSTEMEAVGDLDVVMRVREARPWSPGLGTHGVLSAQVDPANPTLEDLWEGRIDLKVNGPSDRRIKCNISLFDKANAPSTFAHRLPQLTLPVSGDKWRAAFEQHFRRLQGAQDAYDVARRCEVYFDADELGTFDITCEREFTPIRWSIRRNRQTVLLRLLNDIGDTIEPAVSRVAFETPVVENALSYSTEYEVPISGGMYLARHKSYTAALIAPPTLALSTFSDLRFSPHIDSQPRSSESVIRAIDQMFLWENARLPGDLLSLTRRRAVLLAIHRHIFSLVAGDKWAREESLLSNDPDIVSRLKNSITKHRHEEHLSRALALNIAILATAPLEQRIRTLSSLAAEVALFPRTTDTTWLSECALMLASKPTRLRSWPKERVSEGIGRLMEVPTFARAARFFVLATDHELKSAVTSDELYARWDWK